MPVATALQTREEVLEQISSIAKAQSDDFRVRVWFKSRVAAHPELVLSVQNVRLTHLAEPETWIPRLIGGSGDGTYTLDVAHEEAPATTLGKLPDLKISGQPRRNPDGSLKIDWSITDDATWSGPTNITHPQRPVATAAPSFLQIARGAAPQAPLGYELSTTYPQPAPSPAPASGVAEDLIRRDSALRAGEAQLVQTRHALEIEAQAREHQSAMNKMRADFEELKTSLRTPQVAVAPAPAVIPGMDNLLGLLGRVLVKLDAPPVIAPPAPPLEKKPSFADKLFTPEGLVALGGFLLPLLTYFSDRSKGEASAREKMFETMTTMQANASKEQRELLIQMKSGESGFGKIMEMFATAQAQSFTQISNMQDMQMRLMKELQPEPEKDEPMWKEIARSGLAFLVQNQREARAQQLQLAQFTAGAGGAALPPAQTAPVETAAVEINPPGTTAAEDRPDSASLARIKRTIMDMREPHEVASLIVNSFNNDEEFQREVHEYNDELEEMFADHLGEWLEEDLLTREPYATKVMETVAKLLQSIQEQNTPSVAAPPPARRPANIRPVPPPAPTPTVPTPAPDAQV